MWLKPEKKFEFCCSDRFGKKHLNTLLENGTNILFYVVSGARFVRVLHHSSSESVEKNSKGPLLVATPA